MYVGTRMGILNVRTISAGLLLLVLAIPSRAEEEPRRISQDEAKRAVTSKTVPEYPVMARQMKLTGTVELDAYVDTRGRVDRVQVINGNALLTSAAANALKRWTFTPFTTEGKPVRALARFTFSFTP
jgi:TonB family protein